ncbi:MAG: glycosyltransferase family 39 protein, partial [Blastocatellia bacterium]|nr:glycosyltransferase family 39 protein [Blastocatellia bacterium]
MSHINNQENLPLHVFEKFGLALLAGLLVFLVVLSLRVNVHYYDSYEYINNARQLVGIQTRYDIPRPPSFSLVLLPFAWLAKVLDSKAIIERSPYFIMTTAGFGCLLIFWQMLRKLIAREFAMLATLLLAFNAMFLHYWIFLMPEVFACFLIMVYWQAVSKERYLIAAIALGLIFNLRYQLLPLGVLGVLYAVATDRSNWAKLIKNWAFVAFISLVILLGFHYVAITWGAKIDFSGGMKYLTSWLDSLYLGVSQTKDRGSYIDSVAIELAHLFYHVTAPILIIALIGMLKAIYCREKLDWIFLLWFWGVYLTLSLILVPTRKEPRY